MKSKKLFTLSALLFLLFAGLTAALLYVDVRPIGPLGSKVGFAALNGAARELIGLRLGLYSLTDWLSIAALPVMLGFALTGLVQLIRRRSLKKVDADILLLGGFYLLVLAAYLLFEYAVVNYRPVLIEGRLEASYPSSTTMLLLCVMPTAMLVLGRRLKNRSLCRLVNWLIGLFAAAMVAGRLLSGVHWLTDIIGGILLSAALVSLYAGALSRYDGK